MSGPAPEDRNQPVKTLLFATIAIAGISALTLLGDIADDHRWAGNLSVDLVELAIAALVLSPVAVSVIRADLEAKLRWSLFAAVACLALTRILDALDELDSLADVPLIGGNDPLQQTLPDLLFVGSIVFLCASLIGLVRMIGRQERDKANQPLQDLAENVSPSGEPDFLAALVAKSRDVTESVKAESERELLREKTEHTARLEGLGELAGHVSHDINDLLVESTPGRGTKFTACFPATDKPVEELQVDLPASSSGSGDSEFELTGTVLVVDDESSIRRIAQLALEREGVRVLTAKDGADCIRTVKDHREKVAAILLDMTMPRLGGAETYRELRRLGVDVPIVFMSGHSEDFATQELNKSDSVTFLQKPFSVDALLGCIAGAVTQSGWMRPDSEEIAREGGEFEALAEPRLQSRDSRSCGR